LKEQKENKKERQKIKTRKTEFAKLEKVDENRDGD